MTNNDDYLNLEAFFMILEDHEQDLSNNAKDGLVMSIVEELIKIPTTE